VFFFIQAASIFHSSIVIDQRFPSEQRRKRQTCKRDASSRGDYWKELNGVSSLGVFLRGEKCKTRKNRQRQQQHPPSRGIGLPQNKGASQTGDRVKPGQT